MELVSGVILIALLGVLTNRFGHGSRPGYAAIGRRWSDPGEDERLAAELLAASRRRAAEGLVARESATVAGAAESRIEPVVSLLESGKTRIDEAAFAQVGLRMDSARARALDGALGEVADAARTAAERTSSARVVDRVLGAMGRRDLVALASDLGLLTAPLGGGPDTETTPDPVADLLRHLLRDRLVDVLRIRAGQPPFWTWEALPPVERAGATAEAA